eukprot:gnl/MRDRNA2_/MRDRNA2_159162_c0_seq1.p1 gnl/MRDRNA2_/MRDRNA2_159162_c0~~gnl/MRDRNA2_/MRDRNA2_159162_c0_seq1.p1  ORF type:complete len:158 (-),score=16.16 gnl/MRDRNA2_/MRDRNA2_159162_c0_seq1:134-607(-)
MSHDVHSWFDGMPNWPYHIDRAAKLHELRSTMKSAVSGARIAWQTSRYVDMDTIWAVPEKPDAGFYESQGIQNAMAFHAKSIDEKVMNDLGVAVVPRYDITRNYRGLHCDGIHHRPHGWTDSTSWDCFEFEAIEDLILQSGIAALTGTEQVPVCAAS